MKRVVSAFVCVAGALLLYIASLAVVPSPVASSAPDDTPTPVVTAVVEEWAVGGGLLYRANSCFAEEFAPPSDIKRQPVAGGTTRTLDQTQAGNCLTYLNLAAGDDGVYYYDGAEARLEHIPTGEPYTPLVVVDLPANQRPRDNSTLKIAGDYLYWPSTNANAVFRVLRGGGAIETVVDSVASPGDVLVVGNTVYWTDNGGVWTIGVDCGALPCTATKQPFTAFGANTTGYGLLYQSVRFGAFNYAIYWVERTVSGVDNVYRINRRTCSFIVPCTATNTFYTAATNWVIGNPVSDGSNLFWTERFDTIPTRDGKLRRKSLTSGDAADIATEKIGIDRRLAIVNGNLYFAIGTPSVLVPYGIYSLPLNASTIVRDLAVDVVEVTQGIQNATNSAPLVAKKGTFVRVYGKELSGPNAQVVEARLVGTRNGVALPGSPLAPLNGVRALVTGAAYDRAKLSDSWNFLLPASWTEGTVNLRAEIDPRLAYTDQAPANNAVASDFVFQSQPPVCVWTVPVRTHTPLPSTGDANFWAMVDRFKARWPVPDVWIYRDTEPVEELQVCWAGIFPYPCFGPYELEDGWSITNGIPDRDKVLASLWTRALLSFNPDACDDIGAPVHFMGMVHPDANNGGASGYASTVSSQSWVQLPDHTPNPSPTDWFRVRAGSVMAQELGHNFGRKHVNCGNPDNIDGGYPYPPCQLDNAGATSYYGFDLRTQTPIPPTAAADFMSYASRTWVSDYTWRALLNKFAASTVTTAQAPAADAGNVVFAAGYIDLEINQGMLNYLLVLPQASLPSQAFVAVQSADAGHAELSHAAYTLRLLAADNTVLHDEPVTPLPIDDHVSGSQPALFSKTFAVPSGQVAKVQLLADSTVIASLTPGTGLPTVSVQQPAGGAVIDANLTIEWTAADPDPGDQLHHTVQYSYDGGAHWHTLVTEFPGSATGSNRLALADLGSLHGTTGQTAVIRVLASDGYNTAIGLSQPFTVVNRRPDVAILSPVGGESFPVPQPVLLSGAANDAEDGGLSGAASGVDRRWRCPGHWRRYRGRRAGPWHPHRGADRYGLQRQRAHCRGRLPTCAPGRTGGAGSVTRRLL